MKTMVLAYIAGPYTADTGWEVKQNILAAERTSAAVCALGMNVYPVCPHKNTEFMEGLRNGEYFVAGTFEMMRRCDAVLIVQKDEVEEAVGHKSSSGTMGEIEGANRLGIPVFYKLSELKEWLMAGGPEKNEDGILDRAAGYVVRYLNERSTSR